MVFPKRSIVMAFVTGAVVHAVLLALSLTSSVISDGATLLLLVFALPGAIVDMSAEVLHPSKFGGILLAIVATGVNGAAYAVGALAAAKVKERLRANSQR